MTLLARPIPRLAALLGLTLGLLAADARAGSVSHTGAFPLSPYLNGGSYAWPAVAIPKFDLAGQCLTSVCIRLDGASLCDIGFENYQLTPMVVTVNAAASITLQRPDLTTLVTVQPTVTVVDSLPAFDNVLDYGGPSGRTYSGLPGADSDSVCVTGPADLALFSGAGSIGLPGLATDLSSQVGASSWSIGPRPYAAITVTYHYTDCSVPVQPASWSRIKSLYR